MELTSEQLEQYERDGFLLVPDLFDESELGVLKAELPSVYADSSPRRVLEEHGEAVRTVNGSHLVNDVFGRLTRHPRLLRPAQQILGGDTYIYQFKINTKAAFYGEVWKWHQDFIFWTKDDGIPEPRLVSAALFLDPVNEFNGPLMVVPGSHRQGVIEVAANPRRAEAEDGESWRSDVSADLTYTVSQETLAELVRETGIEAPKGGAGSVLFFHPNVVHGSVSNLSPFDRVLVITTYNHVDNVPEQMDTARPEFLVGRDTTPLAPVADDVFSQS